MSFYLKYYKLQINYLKISSNVKTCLLNVIFNEKGTQKFGRFSKIPIFASIKYSKNEKYTIKPFIYDL